MPERPTTSIDAPTGWHAGLDRLQRIQMRLAALALVLMMLVTVADVVLRYVFNSPIRGSYDFVESMLVVLVFHGMSRAFMTRTNIVIDILDTLLGRRVTAVLIRLADVLTLATLVIIGWAMSRIALQAFDYGDRKLELQLPLYVLWIAALAGLAGAMLAAIGALFTPPAASHDDTAP
jgi:TRAP-type C4-dicarboxylate transport system permease small subunit